MKRMDDHFEFSIAIQIKAAATLKTVGAIDLSGFASLFDRQ